MYQENNKRTTTTSNSSITSSSTTRASARAREAEINVAIEGLRQLYQDAIGQPMSAICERALRDDLAAGTPYIFYHYALEETAFAPRPSWRYAQAIVRRLHAQGVTEDDVYFTMRLRC